mgnify:CR=1 FL=1
MLQTIYGIGQEISKGRDPWEDFIEPPKTDGRDDDRRLLTLTVLFDLDKNEVFVEKEGLEVYPSDHDFRKLKEWRTLKTQGGNFKSIYVTVDATKPDLLAKTLFGKQGEEGQYPAHGEFIESILKDAEELKASLLFKVLERIPVLREKFFEKFREDDQKNDKAKLSLKRINEAFQLANKEERIVLLRSHVTCAEFGLIDFPMGNLEGYVDFIEKKFFAKSVTDTSDSKLAVQAKRLCYATGELRDDVSEPDFSGRYNINKFFVQTTINYASAFDSNNYANNYQVSSEIAKYLDRGADYLLKKMTCDIADIRHVVIPQFFNQTEFKESRLKRIAARTDLLFRLNDLKEVDNFLENYSLTDDLYWLTFLAIDSDGNYFKAGNLIKDVPGFHFRNLLEKLEESGALFAPWLGSKYGFNLYSVYKAIPVRKDKEKVNYALRLFAAVLEQRKIEPERLFQHFTELVLCHWFKRYRGYSNILQPVKDNFDFALKDAVFKYIAFFYALRKLDLLKENLSDMDIETTAKKINPSESIEAFFLTMHYTTEQKALFYLGRVLSRVVFEQSDPSKKGHKKNALDKLNFNGMDKGSILRFSEDLFKSARNHGIDDKVKQDWGRFSELFNFNHWEMSPKESLFFILTGYTYFIKSKDAGSESAAE